MINFAAQPLQARQSRSVDLASFNRGQHRTSWLARMLTIAKAAMRRDSGDFRERIFYRLAGGPKLHFSEAGRVDEQHSRGQVDQVPVGRRMSTFPIFDANIPGLAVLHSS